MVETTVVRTIRVKGTSEGIEKLTGDLNKLAGAQDNVAVVSEQSARRVLSAEAAWKRQTMSLDENARMQERIAQANKVADRALQQGVITQQQHAERLTLIQQRYSNVIDATDKFGKSTGLARHELINLGRQAQDVGVSLLSGQSPFMVIAQQGSQIADVFISSGKSVGSFFTQAAGWAGRFLTSTAGIVTGVAAIGAAAVYAAMQFTTSQKTVQEALEEENRLLKLGKELIDAKTDAQKRYLAQLNQQTLYEAERNLLDLQIKRNAAAEEAIRLAERRVMTPSQVPGEMGEVPGAFAPSQVAGFKEVADAAERLKAALAAGAPDLKTYNEELARIARVHPAVRNLVDEMIKFNKEGVDIGIAVQRTQDLIAGLKGTATAAQEAALGINAARTQANAAADHTLARLREENALIHAGTEEFAGRIAAAERYSRLINAGVDSQKAGHIAAQTQANARSRAIEGERRAIEQGIAGIRDATDAWELNRQGVISWSVANDEAGKIMRRNEAAAADYAAAANRLASSIFNVGQAALLANTAFVPFATTWKSMGPTSLGTGGAYQGSQGLTQFRPGGYRSSTGGSLSTSGTGLFSSNLGEFNARAIGEELYGAGNVDENGVPTREYLYGNLLTDYYKQFGGNASQVANALLTRGPFTSRAGEEGPFGMSSTTKYDLDLTSQAGQQVMSRLINLMPDPQKITTLEAEIAKIQQSPDTIERAELLQQLNEQLKQLKEATEDNTNALNAQVDPLFSQGHEFINSLKIGYYKAATGLTGVVTGTGGPDSTPVHMMLTPGETVQVLPPEWARGRTVSNDNSRNVNVTQNITINTTPADRLTGRQRAQGFIAAATRAVGV